MTLAFDGMTFFGLMLAMGYAPGADAVLIPAVVGGLLTPLIALGGTAALLVRLPKNFDVLATSLAALALVLFQLPGCLWLGTSVRWGS